MAAAHRLKILQHMRSIRVGLPALAVVFIDIFPKLSEIRVGSRLDVIDGVGMAQTTRMRTRERSIFALVLSTKLAPCL